MNQSSSSNCDVTTYFNFCGYMRIIMIVPGLGLNVFIFISTIACLLKKNRKIKKNVAMFITGSTICNIVNMTSWPIMIHWRIGRKWLLSSIFCEIMVSIKQISSTVSFHYVFSISFSIYLTIVFGYNRIVDHNMFLAFELIFPFVPVVIKELSEHFLHLKNPHYDASNRTCFTIINDRPMMVLMLIKIVAFLPLTMYFYAHILHTVFRSAQQMHRSQKANKKLATVFSAISLITFAAHTPGGIMSLIAEHNICFETATEFLFDLPLFTSPIILFCMNKELRTQCFKFLKRTSIGLVERNELTNTIAGQHKNYARGLGDKTNISGQ